MVWALVHFIMKCCAENFTCRLCCLLSLFKAQLSYFSYGLYDAWIKKFYGRKIVELKLIVTCPPNKDLGTEQDSYNLAVSLCINA